MRVPSHICDAQDMENPGPCGTCDSWADLGWPEDRVWVTAEGEEIPYHEITDRHLHNIIKWLQHNISEVYSGYWPQGEQAGYALEAGLTDAEGILEDLETERDRRREEPGKGIHQAMRV